MIKAVVHTQKYFQAPEHCFWRWGEDGSVIEWNTGSTICYRDDLVNLLTALTDKGLPPFGSLLLLLSACREEFSIHHKFFLLRGVKDYTGDNRELYAQIDKVINFSKIVFSLPDALRTGTARIHLVQEIFAQNGFVFSNVQVKESVAELAAGRVDELIFTPGERLSQDEFVADILPFAEAIDRFPDKASLELKLNTGLNKLPQPLPAELPDDASASLLDQLANDPQTAGMARLTRRLVAALNIPLHTQNSGDQSYGGISDITNRGNYDKLLLSELAHDTDLLMARLVNNEALYFRREEPPDNPKRKRILLIDSTLKLWGLPRVFALSAALAFAQYNKHGEVTEAYILGSETYRQADLNTKEAVTVALGMLHHGLHCGKALQSAIKDLAGEGDAEIIFITMPGNLLQPAFAAYYSGIREMLNFTVMVDREGQFAFHECKGGRSKLLNTARFDLDEILFPVYKPGKPGELVSGNKPAFLLLDLSPLLFPKTRIARSLNTLFHDEQRGVVAVTENCRLLYMKQPVKGAMELLSYIEKGNYCFGWGRDNLLHVLVLVANSRQLKLYSADPELGLVKCTVLREGQNRNLTMVYRDNKFYLRLMPEECIVDCGMHTISPCVYDSATMPKFPSYILPADAFRMINKFGNYLYISCNVMTKVKQIYINRDGQLAIGNYFLGIVQFHNGPAVMVKENVYKLEGSCYAKEVSNNHSYLQNRKIKFGIRRWDDGSEAVIDSRGMVHLKSSDRSLPEVSFFLITGMATACWAADGTVAGNNYFFKDGENKNIPADLFYVRYIQPIINKLKQA